MSIDVGRGVGGSRDRVVRSSARTPNVASSQPSDRDRASSVHGRGATQEVPHESVFSGPSETHEVTSPSQMCAHSRVVSASHAPKRSQHGKTRGLRRQGEGRGGQGHAEMFHRPRQSAGRPQKVGDPESRFSYVVPQRSARLPKCRRVRLVALAQYQRRQVPRKVQNGRCPCTSLR